MSNWDSGTTKASTQGEKTRWFWQWHGVGLSTRKMLKKSFYCSSYPILILHCLGKLNCLILHLRIKHEIYCINQLGK
uniref:Uncharacterized protein n=1 Tax=Rhizophora mucronata TaxID=61149 RepID=A0A2P2KYI0_RHIMU